MQQKTHWINTYVEWDYDGNELVQEGFWSAAPVIQFGAANKRASNWAFHVDGTESGAAIVGSQDVNPTKGDIAVDTVFQYRQGIEEDGGGGWMNYTVKLQVEKNATGGFIDVTATSSNVQSVAGAVTDNEDTTQRVSSMTFDTTNGGVDEVDGTAGDGVSDFTNNGCEVLFSIQIIGADVADDDTLLFRVVEGDGTALNNYPTPVGGQITVEKLSGVEVVVPLGTFSFAGPIPAVAAGASVATPLKTYAFAGLIPNVGTGVIVDLNVGGGGPIAFGSAVDSATTTSGGTPNSVTIPTHNSGDLLAVVVCSTLAATPATAINTPSGWTKGPDIEAGNGSAVRLTLFLKDGDGAESSVNITLSGDPTFVMLATCLVFTDAETAASVIDVSGTVVQEDGINITSPDVTASENDVAVLYAFCFDGDASAPNEATVDSDPGFSGTLRGYEELGSGLTNGCVVASSTKTQGSGATGTCVWSTNGDNDAGCAFTVVLKSGAGTGAIGSFAFAGLLPEIVTGVNVVSPLKTFTFGGLIPEVVTGVNVVVPLKTFTFAGFVPAVNVVDVQVPLKTFSFTGLVPAVGTGVIVPVPSGTFSFAGLIPEVVTGVNVITPLQTFSFAGLIPEIVTGVNVISPVQTFTFAGLIPAIAAGGGVDVGVPLGVFAFSGLVPIIDVEQPPVVIIPRFDQMIEDEVWARGKGMERPRTELMQLPHTHPTNKPIRLK